MTGAANSVHASCISIDGAGVLLRGPSGSGKSDLALRLIDEGAVLVADDQTVLTVEEKLLIASAPEPLRGLLEVRGVGILSMAVAPPAPVVLVVDLVELDHVERLPDMEYVDIEGNVIRRVRLSSKIASTSAKIRLLVQRIGSETGSKP